MLFDLAIGILGISPINSVNSLSVLLLYHCLSPNQAYTVYSICWFEKQRCVSVDQVSMCVSGPTCTLSSFAFCWFSKERCSLTDESCSLSCCSLAFFTCICSSSLVDRSFNICHSQGRNWSVGGNYVYYILQYSKRTLSTTQLHIHWFYNVMVNHP